MDSVLPGVVLGSEAAEEDAPETVEQLINVATEALAAAPEAQHRAMFLDAVRDHATELEQREAQREVRNPIIDAISPISPVIDGIAPFEEGEGHGGEPDKQLALADLPPVLHGLVAHDDAVLRLAAFKIKQSMRTSRPAEALFWPSGRPLVAQKLQEVFSKAWKLDPPNMIVYLEAGAAHPKNFATDMLIKQPQFKEWCKIALAQAQLTHIARESRRPPPASGPSKSASVETVEVPQAVVEDDEVVTVVINRMLFQKLVMVFCAILDAATLTNNWIVIDRSKGSSATAELLIEMALKQNNLSPTVLVIERRARIEQFLSDEAKAQVQAIHRLQSISKAFGDDTQQRVRVDLDALYDASEFSDGASFRNQEYVDLPLPVPPIREHITKSGVEVQVLGAKEKIKIGRKRLWMYHYTQFMFSGGTHYIFLEDSDQTFPLDALGPIGAIFAHGGTAACERMRSWLQLGKPTVMLFNSGGCTQAFASLHDAVVKRHYHDENKILGLIQLVSTERWASTFGIAEIMIMRELNLRAPVHTRKAVVSVDVIRDSAESVLQVVTNCFAAAAGDLPELGLGSAESDVVFRAWRQQEALLLNAAKQRKLANVLFYVSMLLSFLIALLATVGPMLGAGGGFGTVADALSHVPAGSEYSILGYVIVVLPLLSGIVATMTSRFRALQKWGVLRAAAFKSVTEIYKFRARVLEYDVVAPLAVNPETMEEAEGHNTQKRSTAYEARAHFVSEIQRIFSNVMDGDMNADALFFKGKLAPDGGPVDTDHSPLDKHVSDHIMHCRNFGGTKKARAALRSRYRDPSGDANEEPRSDVGAADLLSIELDNHLSPISIETYVEFRVKLLLAYYCEEGPRLSWWQAFLDMLSFLIIGLAAFFAILQMFDWVTMTVAVSSIIKNIDQHCSFGVRLTALNAAVRDIQNMMVWWDSLTVIDRRTRATKTRALMIVEAAALNEALAGTGEVASITSFSSEPSVQADERRDGQANAKKE